MVPERRPHIEIYIVPTVDNTRIEVLDSRLANTVPARVEQIPPSEGLGFKLNSLGQYTVYCADTKTTGAVVDIIRESLFRATRIVELPGGNEVAIPTGKKIQLPSHL